MKYSELESFIKKNKMLQEIEEKPGIYAITVDKNIVYVGQGKDIYRRCAQHIYNTENAILSQEKKYLLLLSAKLGGHDIDYMAIEYCEEAQLREREDYFIAHYKPILNINTPYGKQDISHLKIEDILT